MKEIALQTVKEYIKENASYITIKAYLFDLVRSKDITWEDVREILDFVIDNGYDCSLVTF